MNLDYTMFNYKPINNFNYADSISNLDYTMFNYKLATSDSSYCSALAFRLHYV